MAGQASVIYINGDMVSMDFGNRRFEAVAVAGDRILAIGNCDQINPLAENPLDIDPVKIKGLNVLAAIVGGDVIYGEV